MDLRQFKLTNQEEIVCEVVEWHDVSNTVLIKNAFRIFASEELESATRYYTYKPWLLIHNKIDSITVLHKHHIVAETYPSDPAVKYYTEVLSDFMNEEEISEILDEATEEQLTDQAELEDSDSPSVIVH